VYLFTTINFFCERCFFFVGCEVCLPPQPGHNFVATNNANTNTNNTPITPTPHQYNTTHNTQHTTHITQYEHFCFIFSEHNDNEKEINHVLKKKAQLNTVPLQHLIHRVLCLLVLLLDSFFFAPALQRQIHCIAKIRTFNLFN
jgi:hypothetical protein